MHPLALSTLGRYMPTVGLRGNATGPLRLKGLENNLAINTQLTFSDGGFSICAGRSICSAKRPATTSPSTLDT